MSNVDQPEIGRGEGRGGESRRPSMTAFATAYGEGPQRSVLWFRGRREINLWGMAGSSSISSLNVSLETQIPCRKRGSVARRAVLMRKETAVKRANGPL